MRPSRAEARLAAIRNGRQRQSRAVFAGSSTRNPLPSHRPNSQGCAGLAGWGAAIAFRIEAGAVWTAPRPERRALLASNLRGCRPWRSTSSETLLLGVAHEPRVLRPEGQRHLADRPVAVLGDDQIGLAGVLGGARVV